MSQIILPDGTCSCPNPAVCQRVKFHVIGRIWELWQTRPDYRALWQALADGTPWPPPGGVPVAPSGRSGHALIAPLGTVGCGAHNWHGCCPRKPWEYTVSVALPTIGMPELASAAVALLRLQYERPYILIVDTGSDDATCQELEKLRSDDCEIHYIRSHGYIHSSAPVGAAMDLAFALCQTRFLFCTHTDCFLTRHDSLSWLMNQCSETCPAVGYGQSPRNTPGWETAVGHVFTMLHMPTMRKYGVQWAWHRYYESAGLPAGTTIGYPDTEQPFNLCLQQAGIIPRLIGRETNHERQLTEYFDHARTLPGARIYGHPMKAAIEAYGAAALREARERARAWAIQASPPAQLTPIQPRGKCRHLGEPTGDEQKCGGCQGNVRRKVFACRHPSHGTTTLQYCLVCSDWQEEPDHGTPTPQDSGG
jgi:hypothetical protein